MDGGSDADAAKEQKTEREGPYGIFCHQPPMACAGPSLPLLFLLCVCLCCAELS